MTCFCLVYFSGEKHLFTEYNSWNFNPVRAVRMLAFFRSCSAIPETYTGQCCLQVFKVKKAMFTKCLDKMLPHSLRYLRMIQMLSYKTHATESLQILF